MMFSPSLEHIKTTFEIGSCSLLMAVWWGVRRQGRQHTESFRIHSASQEAQLHQKDLIIREVHHRVANQMGLTAALLHLQATRSVNPEAQACLFEGENRIRTLSDLHARLYQTNPGDPVALYPYLSALAGDLITTLRPDLAYCPADDSAAPSSRASTAIICGLLVHELVTNCLKHAFPFNRAGTIRFSLSHPPPNRLRLSIHDNGSGLPPGFSLDATPHSGLAIISALIRDLAGTFSAISHQPGTEFIVEFPLLKN
jgi:two-component sensor histidine kinase